MKKLISALLSLVLALSLVTGAFAAAGRPPVPNPTPAPTVTLVPIDPADPPAQPMDDLFDPDPINRPVDD